MSDIEGSNFGDTSTFVDSPEFNIGSSDQFIGNFLEKPGDFNHIVKNKIWVTSDTHFGHAKVIEYCDRPFNDIHEMDRELIKRWNINIS